MPRARSSSERCFCVSLCAICEVCAYLEGVLWLDVDGGHDDSPVVFFFGVEREQKIPVE